MTYTDAKALKGAFVGTCIDSIPNGQGKISYSNGDQFNGVFKHGRRDGKGLHSLSNGDRYEGVYKEGHKVQGKFTWANGDTYLGPYSNDLPHGHGIYTGRSGDRYVGEYKAGKRHGEGVYYFADGRVKRVLCKLDKCR